MTKKNPSPSKARNKDRSDANTTMTISLPKELKDAIAAKAAEENRPISNYMVTELTKILKSGGFLLITGAGAAHLARSPSDWSPESMVATGQAICASLGF